MSSEWEDRGRAGSWLVVMERLREDKMGREDRDKERKREGEKGGIMRFINRVEEVVKVGDGS